MEKCLKGKMEFSPLHGKSRRRSVDNGGRSCDEGGKKYFGRKARKDGDTDKHAKTSDD